MSVEQSETPARASETTSSRKIIVSLPEHRIHILENGKELRAITSFSTGRDEHLTPLVANGGIDPDRRYRHHSSSLYNDKAGHQAEMPFALFFEGGCAFHEGDPKVESHGCIHLAHSDAEWLFAWVG